MIRITGEAPSRKRPRARRGVSPQLRDDLRGRESGAWPSGALLPKAQRDDAGDVR